MDAVRKLVGDKRLAGEPIRIADVQEACPGIGPRLARTLLDEAEALERPGRPWPDHVEYARDMRVLIMKRRGGRQAITPQVVMDALGVGRDVAVALLAEHGIPAGGATDDELMPWVTAIADRDGIPVDPRTVMDELRIGRPRADRLLARIPGALRDPVPPANVPGSGNRNAKLTEEKVRAIKAAIDAVIDAAEDTGESQKTIAGRFGVDESTVSRIKHGSRWGHVKLGAPA
jgi:hypothetical protein